MGIRGKWTAGDSFFITHVHDLSRNPNGRQLQGAAGTRHVVGGQGRDGCDVSTGREAVNSRLVMYLLIHTNKGFIMERKVKIG